MYSYKMYYYFFFLIYIIYIVTNLCSHIKKNGQFISSQKVFYNISIQTYKKQNIGDFILLIWK